MVAVHALTLFALLPTLALGAHIPRDARHHAPAVVARGVAVADGGVNAGHRSAARAVQNRKRTCKARPATVSSADDSAATATTTTEYANDDATPTTTEDNSAAAVETSAATTDSSDSSSDDNSSQVTSSQDTSSDNSSSQDTSSDESSSTTTAAAEPTSTPLTVSNAVATSGSSLLSIYDATCGWCDSSDAAPNGSEDWLNCGINSGGWTPPMVTLSDLISVELTASGPFAVCADYFGQFNSYGGQYGIPPILLASIALQESTCNPSATGGNGEAGLMQLATANCADAPNGNCYDVDFNVGQGAKYFAQVLSENSGNVLAALGSYNGWFIGMTYADATAAKAQGDCYAQNNLDYLTSTLNGWMQGIEGYNLGSYRNLDGC